MAPTLRPQLTLDPDGLFGLFGPLPAAEKPRSSPRPGFVALFNGVRPGRLARDAPLRPSRPGQDGRGEEGGQVAEWTADAKQHWSVKDGDLVNDGHGAYLTTDKDYGDIELLIDYKTVAKADSGIYLRANPQVQIWDYTKEGGKQDLGADKGSGGLWNNSPGAPGKDPLVLADKPFGEWNSLRIIQMVGERTTVYLNGKLVVDQRPDGELLRTRNRSCRCFASKGRSSSRPTAARSAGRTSSSARSRPPRPTRCSGAEATPRASRTIFDGKSTLRAGEGRIDQLRGRRRQPPSASPARAARSTTTTSYPTSSARRRIPAPARRQQRPGHPLPRQAATPPTPG